MNARSSRYGFLRMRKGITISLIIIIVAVVALLLISSTPPNPIAIIEVVDAAGKPVEGAVIKPDGLHAKKSGSYYGWSEDNLVKPSAVKTDKRGIAQVPYPRYVEEKQETSEINFSVNHPDFCSDRPFRTVSITPPANAKLLDKLKFVYGFLTRRIIARPDPVVLKRGGIVKVSGFMNGKDLVTPHLHAQLSSMYIPHSGFWHTNDSGALINRRVSEGTEALRLVYLQPNGKACFSDTVSFTSVPGQTNEFRLELKPGFRVDGQLDVSVPRPVMHGQVQIWVSSPSANANSQRISWRAGRKSTQTARSSSIRCRPGIWT